MVFGILGCYPFMWLAPVAWVMGNREIERIDAGLLPEEGRRRARIGQRLGIVASVFWGAILGLVLVAFSLSGA